MNVLSLFDGMSCGQIALNKSGIKVDNYFASEIDTYAITIAQKNFPNTTQLGDVSKIRFSNGFLISEKTARFIGKIDLLIGGSPCQGFSFAGKQLNFADPRSALFFEYVRIWKEIKAYNPDAHFLLENVKMKKEHLGVISTELGVAPVFINSALVSAQNRQRFYWTNIDGIQQPEDRGILLKDVIDSGEIDLEKAYCLDANYYKGGNPEQYFNKSRRQLVFARTNRSENGERLITITGDKSGTITARYHKGVKSDGAPFLTDFKYFRMLTPTECERLQTVPEGYTEGVSNTQRYRMLGNGWTVDVIAHIFQNLPQYQSTAQTLNIAV